MFTCGNIFEEDIFSQPESLEQSLDFAISKRYPAVIQMLKSRRFSKVVLTGMGSSYAVCLNAGLHLNRAGVPSWVVATSELLHYQLEMITLDTLVIIVSQSGASGETLNLCRSLPKDVTVLAVTNEPQSELARRGNEVMLLHVKPETSVSTRTYLTSMMLMDLLAGIFAGQTEAKLETDLRSAIDCLQSTLYDFGEMKERLESFFGLPNYMMFLARGYSYATAQAGALFTREVAKYPAMECESAQFRHGPFEIVEQGFAAMIFIPADPCQEMQVRMAQDISDHGGKVAVVAQTGVAVPQNERMMVIRQEYPSPELAPYANIVPVQATADYILQKKDVVAGTFRAASKVTSFE